MSEKSPELSHPYLVVPCAGLEKLTGQMSFHVGVQLMKIDSAKIFGIKPSLPQIMAKLPKDGEIPKETQVFALNGCGSQCVSKILAELQVKTAGSYVMSQFLKGKNYRPQSSTELSKAEMDLIPAIAQDLLQELNRKVLEITSTPRGKVPEFQPEYDSWKEYSYTKFIFSLPIKQKDLYFNGNDVWAYCMGSVVFVGITDYMQKQMSDIITAEMPKVGEQVEQFEGKGSLESSKTVTDIICPVSGVVIGVNSALVESPDLINSHPYTKGWLFAIEASNLQEDVANLMRPEEYYTEMVQKIQKEHH